MESKSEEEVVDVMVKEGLGRKVSCPGEKVVVVHGMNEDFSDEHCIVRIITA
jgi:hypothetical protein